MRRCPPWMALLPLFLWLVSCTALLDFKPGRDADTTDDREDIDADTDRADEAGDADAADDPAPDREEGRDDELEGEVLPDILDVPDVLPDDAVEADGEEECSPPRCFYEGSCYGEGESPAGKDCLRCNEADMAALPDGNPCGTAGICCDGTCNEGWGCCTEEQCPPSCIGVPVPCASMGTDPVACQSHGGCKANGACGSGEYVDCPGIEDSLLCDHCGCAWDGGTPPCKEGPSAPACSDFVNDYDRCINCYCTFFPSQCVDYPGAYHCSNYATQEPCDGQVGCRWADFDCSSSHYCIEL